MVNEKVMEQIEILTTIFIIHIERAIRINLVARFFCTAIHYTVDFFFFPSGKHTLRTYRLLVAPTGRGNRM